MIGMSDARGLCHDVRLLSKDVHAGGFSESSTNDLSWAAVGCKFFQNYEFTGRIANGTSVTVRDWCAFLGLLRRNTMI